MKTAAEDIRADPFGEGDACIRRSLHILGGRFGFTCNDPRLLDLVNQAYAGLPVHRLPLHQREFRVHLRVAAAVAAKRAVRTAARRESVPPLQLFHGAGLLAGADGLNSVVMVPHQAAALIAVDPSMLRNAYYTRYELIEFAVVTLAARAQRLVPLHAACVGLNGRGVLLLGPSGAGKSTVSLHCLAARMDFLAEDAVFVTPGTLHATGVPNFLHIRTDSIASMQGSWEADVIRGSPVIRRRSGVEKFEVDLRRREFRLAPRPLKIVAVAFLSPRRASPRMRLTGLSPTLLRGRLEDSQPYAASLPQWGAFARRIAQVPAFELRRGSHPTDTVELLRGLLSAT